MEAGNHKQVAIILKRYKLPSGRVNFSEIFKIPLTDRLISLYKKDFLKTTAILVAAISSAFEKLNLKKKDYGSVVNDIAEDILDNYERDNLALEDIMIFLQKLSRGEYGNIEEISLSRFNNLFEKYLNERWDEAIRIRDERHEEYKKIGDDNWYERSSGRETDNMDMQLKHWKQKVMEKNDEKQLDKRYK